MAVDAGTQITDLQLGDHACLTYGEREELLDLTAAFVRDGLSAGLKVVWLSDEVAAQAASELTRREIEVEPAVASGQFAAVPSEGRLVSGKAFRTGQANEWLNSQLSACQQEGFQGLRVAMDMNWALQPVTGVEQLPEFEQGLAAVLAGGAVSVLCQYDRERFDPVTLGSVAGFHTRSVAASTYHADAVLRICRQYAPPGIRIAGEIDFRAAEPLALALAEAIRLAGDITINLASLSFIDAACTRMIMDAARGTAGARKVFLVCSASVADRFASLGAAGLPGVSLVSVDDG
ncbi:MAG: MEDS domain-containing protein [Actinobacteria bacterium]|nr:MEDS domain-containing protein [Actinomycetota bacterium]